MLDSSVLLWGWTGSVWGKVLIDAAGHLQVDTLSSALPTGAATAAHQVTTHGYIDNIETLLAGGLPATLDTLALKVREQGTPTVRCTGWDGVAYQNLLVEDATNFNLRVKLFDGANALDCPTIAAGYTDARGLRVVALVGGYVSGNIFYTAYASAMAGDNISATSRSLYTYSFLAGFDGANWDRLRTYGVGILKVGRAEVGLSDIRVTAAGQIKASAGKLYWITVTATAAGQLLNLSDDTDGSTAAIITVRVIANDTKHLVFDPPLEFATGIYAKTVTNSEVTAGYL